MKTESSLGSKSNTIDYKALKANPELLNKTICEAVKGRIFTGINDRKDKILKGDYSGVTIGSYLKDENKKCFYFLVNFKKIRPADTNQVKINISPEKFFTNDLKKLLDENILQYVTTALAEIGVNLGMFAKPGGKNKHGVFEESRKLQAKIGSSSFVQKVSASANQNQNLLPREDDVLEFFAKIDEAYEGTDNIKAAITAKAIIISANNATDFEIAHGKDAGFIKQIHAILEKDFSINNITFADGNIAKLVNGDIENAKGENLAANAFNKYEAMPDAQKQQLLVSKLKI